MILACSSASLRREIPHNRELIDFPAWAGSQGFAAVEIAETHLPQTNFHYLADLRRACDNAGVGVAAIATDNDFTVPDADKRLQQVEHLRYLINDVAQPLGATMIKVYLGMADTSPAGDQRALETFRLLVPDMESTSIGLALENHARVQTGIEQMIGIVNGVPTPLFGACVDFGSEPADRRYQAITALAPFAFMAHARGRAFDAKGEETHIDYQRCIAALREAAFDGVISVFYEGDGNPYQGTLNIRNLVRQYWSYPQTNRQAA